MRLPGMGDVLHMFAVELTGSTGQLRADEITGTISKAEPADRQDGTSAHPFAAANQCPPSTDVVVWPRDGQPIPSLPPHIGLFCGHSVIQ